MELFQSRWLPPPVSRAALTDPPSGLRNRIIAEAREQRRSSAIDDHVTRRNFTGNRELPPRRVDSQFSGGGCCLLRTSILVSSRRHESSQFRRRKFTKLESYQVETSEENIGAPSAKYWPRRGWFSGWKKINREEETKYSHSTRPLLWWSL